MYAVSTGFVHLDDSADTGQWDGRTREGKRRLANADGGMYEGELKNNAAHVSRRPTLIRESHTSALHAFQGYGQYTHPSGDVYEGEWKADQADGYGIFTHADGSR